MNTITTASFRSLIARLFADAESSDAPLRASVAALSAEERAALLKTTDYKALYGRAKDAYLAVSAETGTLLYLLARSSGARAIVEFGTSFGISTLHLAAALKDNGGGRLIGSELEASKAERARENLTAAGLSELVDIREGDAIETLGRDLPNTIDLVLLDGAKSLYPRILELLEPRLGPRALIVADNADASPEYLARVRAPGGGYLSVPFASDVELSMRLG